VTVIKASARLMPRFTTVDGAAEDVVGLDGRDLGSGARYHLHPDCCIRRVLAMIARARLRMAGGGIAPGIETSADRRTDHDLFAAMTAIRSPGSSTPSSDQKLACSRPLTPAATAFLIPAVPWASAAIGSPCRWASSTAAVSSSAVN
jgi:hypothetical protein